MPRRASISEKKRERLMQENDLLQRLMLESRSSIRRSSLKEKQDANLTQPYQDHSIENDTATEPAPAQVAIPEAEITVIEEHHPEQEETLLVSTFSKPHTPQSQSDTKISDKTVREEAIPAEGETFSKPHAAGPQPEPQVPIINIILPEQNVPALEEHVKQPEAAGAKAPVPAEKRPVPVNEKKPEAGRYEFPAKKRKRPQAGVYAALLSGALLLGFGGYYLYNGNQKSKDAVAGNGTQINTKPAAQNQSPAAPDPVIVRNEKAANAGTAPIDTKKPVSEPVAATSETTAPEVKTKTTESAPDTAPLQYKVISKAYFHDEPREDTRRKAFIIHWNNAVLTPLEEKAGFVYIVFTNHLGQTSKGWLRKKDLKPLN